MRGSSWRRRRFYVFVHNRNLLKRVGPGRIRTWEKGLVLDHLDQWLIPNRIKCELWFVFMLRSKKALSNFQSLPVCERLLATVTRWLGSVWGHNDGWPQSRFFVAQSDNLTWVFWPGRHANRVPGYNFKCWELYFLELYYPFLPLCQRLLLLRWRKFLLRSSQRVFREFLLPIFQPMKDVLIGRRLRVEHPCFIHLDLCHVKWL